MRRLKRGGRQNCPPHGAAEPQPNIAVLLPRGENIELSGASDKRRLPTGAQVFNLPHKAVEPQPKRRLEPAMTGETACPTKIVAAGKGIRM
jgi:hypothetical protein